MTPSALKPDFLDGPRADALKKDAAVTYIDAFERQLKELYIIDNAKLLATSTKKELLDSTAFQDYVSARSNSFAYAYYPWNKHLVRTVREDDYFRLKTNRNQDLITADEQKRLYSFRVAVLGLSVGSNIAFTLAQAGISREIVLADFDDLDTSNLNRIMAGVHQVGVNKAIIASRRIHEDNPFADVTALQDGINADNLENLLKEGKIDCIVEEVDDILFKIEARKLAMRYRAPVIMITDNGDGIVLHVERYDLGHDKIFGKSPSAFDPLEKRAFTREMAGKMIMENIVGGAERVDPLMLSSVRRVLAHELVSWSQLGSAAILGGVAATYMIKQIALNKDARKDIRAYIAPTSGMWSTHTE